MVVDGISQVLAFSPASIARLADRKRGIGFDQLLLVEPPFSPEHDFFYRIFNADGSEVGQCGNGARCFARFVRHNGLTWKNEIRVGTSSGELLLKVEEDGNVLVNMGAPRLLNSEVPTTLNGGPHYCVSIDGLAHNFTGVSMGNPHAVLRVNDVNSAAVVTLGKTMCEHSVFPQQANIGFMEIIARDHIRLRVYERGVGETEACGTGACAAVVAGRLHQWLDEQVKVDLPGGSLRIRWRGENQAVMMSGPTALVYEGQIEL
jgi:diaminopimelate epimerase